MNPVTSELTDISVPSLWDKNTEAVRTQLDSHLRFDRLALAVPSHDGLEPDDLITATGWGEETPAPLLAGFEDSPLAATAQAKGVAVSSPQHRTTNIRFLEKDHVFLATLSASVHSSRSWQLLLTRRDQAFTVQEMKFAELVLRQWYCQFAYPSEPGLGQFLFAEDGRLIDLDLGTQTALVDDDQQLDQIGRTLLEIIRQRYPKPQQGHRYELEMTLGSSSRWLTARREQVLKGAHWFVESRPLTATELAAPGVLADDRVAKALGYIDSHYVKSPSLSDIAEVACMSQFHFHRLFRKAVGISPKQYLLLKQLEVGRWLLRTSMLTVSRVAKRTGFISHGHFTNTFCRVVGQTPTAYRQQYAETRH